MQIQKQISKLQVIENFEDLINDYCEQIHLKTGKLRSNICKIMVNEFHGKIGHEDDWIRKKIDTRYKSMYRIENGKLRSKKNRKLKLSEKFNRLEEGFTQIAGQTIGLARKG